MNGRFTHLVSLCLNVVLVAASRQSGSDLEERPKKAASADLRYAEVHGR